MHVYPLEIPEIQQVLDKLPLTGYITCSPDGLTYLKIEDDYIHQVHALLEKKVEKPKYFDLDANFIGAHISIIYLEETTIMEAEDIGT